MKKSLTIVATFIVVLLIFSNFSSLALSATATLNPSATKARKGEYITIDFVVNPSAGYNGFEGRLDWDKDFFTDVTVTPSSTSYKLNEDAGFNEFDPDDGSDDRYIIIDSSNPIEAGTLFTIKLKVKENTTKTSGQVGFASGSELDIFDEDVTVDIDVLPVSIELDETEPPVDPPVNNTINNTTNRITPANNTTGNLNKSNTAANKVIPYTGSTVVLPLIGIIAVIGTAAYVRYKKTKID